MALRSYRIFVQTGFKKGRILLEESMLISEVKKELFRRLELCTTYRNGEVIDWKLFFNTKELPDNLTLEQAGVQPSDEIGIFHRCKLCSVVV